MEQFDKPITRKEQYLSYLNGNTNISPSEPITREELYLSYLCGNTRIELPEPITRIERYLYSLCVNGGNVGGGDNGGGNKPADVEMVSWTDGADAQIAAIAQALRAGTITPEQTGWEVGDERTVQLSAIKSEYMGNHVEQTQTLVILHKGGKLLENGDECSFVVGLKNCLANGTELEAAVMNPTTSNSGGWDNCQLRNGCNGDFVKMIPEDLRPAFAEFQNISADGSGDTAQISIDLFAFPAETEVFGRIYYASSVAEAHLFQFDYFKTLANRIKRAGNNGSEAVWWGRSPARSYKGFCFVDEQGGVYDFGNATIPKGIAPFGCI